MSATSAWVLGRRDALILGAGVLVAIIVVMFFPGVMTKDSKAALDQARTLDLTDWHPPIMAIVWRYLDAIIRGPLLMLVCQAVLYGWAVSKLCVEAFPDLGRRIPLWLLIPLFGVFPPVMALTGMIWKDTWMSGLLLLALGNLYAIANATARAGRWRAFAWLCASCLAATAFRHNALSATAGLLAGGIYLMMTDRSVAWLRLAIACGGGVVLSFAFWSVNGLATRAMTTPSHPTTSILLHDIAGTISRSENPRQEASHLLASHPSVSSRDLDQFMAQLERNYDAADANGILRSSRRTNVPFDIIVHQRDHNAAAVKAAWRDILARNPRAYFAHRWATFQCLIQLCNVEQWAIRSYVLNKSHLGIGSSSAAQARLRTLLLDPRTARLYSPAFWLFICLLAAGVALVNGRGKGKIPLFMGLSALGLAVALFLTSPIGSYRYMHWVIVLGWANIFILINSATSWWATKQGVMPAGRQP